MFRIKYYSLFVLLALPAFVGLVLPMTLYTVQSMAVVDTVKGVAIESSRDLNESPQAPVKYTFSFNERVEFVEGSYVEGDSVNVTVDQYGSPVAVFPLSHTLLINILTVAFGVFISLMLFLTVDDKLDQMRFQLRSDTFSSR